MLSVRRLSFDRVEQRVLQDVSFDLKAGEILAFLGPSGCGKTTLLNLVAGFLKPTGGQIERTIACPGPKLGYMRQDHGLLPWLTAKENIRLATCLCPAIPSADEKALEAALARFGLAAVQQKKPCALSGGQRQRLALLRTLWGQPSLLLLDEPFAHLDTALRLSLARHVRAYVTDTAAAALLVTHQMEEAIQMADRIMVLGAHPTRILTAHDLHGTGRAAALDAVVTSLQTGFEAVA